MNASWNVLSKISADNNPNEITFEKMKPSSSTRYWQLITKGAEHKTKGEEWGRGGEGGVEEEIKCS